MDTLPLASFRVVDLTQNVAGPFCTQILGDLGADVIKVEPLAGDSTRTWGPPFWGTESVMFLSFNRNKRSICLDLKAPKGREILDRFLGWADICVTALTPAAASKLRVDAGSIHGSHRSLITCDVTAFGSQGPFRDLPGFDPVIQALSGIMSITGERSGSSVRVGTSIVDMGVGMWAAIGILAAALGRSKSSEGGEVATSLFETALAWMPYQVVGHLATGGTPMKWGSELAMLCPYGAYRAQDSDIVVAVGNEDIWTRFCRCIERVDLTETPGFRSNSERVDNRTTVRDVVEEVLSKATAAVWERRFRDAGVPAGRVNTIPEAMGLDQSKAVDMFQATVHPQVDSLRTARVPLSFDGEHAQARRPPPLLGEHSDEVLSELGFNEREVAGFHETRVVG